MKKLIGGILFVSMFHLTCGVETILILLPAISATWCDEANPCHKYEFRPGQEASDTQDKGNIGGAEYWIKNGNKFKIKDMTQPGENFIIGSYNGLNTEFAVHYRLDQKYEEYYVGSVEIDDQGNKKMYIENLTTNAKLILTTNSDACNCK